MLYFPKIILSFSLCLRTFSQLLCRHRAIGSNAGGIIMEGKGESRVWVITIVLLALFLSMSGRVEFPILEWCCVEE